MTDDQTLEQMSALPETRKLIGTQGVKFKRFYVTDPLCCPSRATFLTGQYAHNTGVISNGGPNGLDALDQQDTLGVWLQQAGYRTAFVGKYLNGYGLDDPEQVPPGWSDWHALLEPTTQDYFDYELNENGEITEYGATPDDYKTTVLGDLAVDAVRPAARGNRPLFLYLGFNAPHAPSTPAPRDAGSLAGVQAPRTPAFDEERPLRQAELPSRPAAARVRGGSRESTRATSARSSRWPRSTARSPGSSRCCGTKGELGSTYIFFTSDNGYIDGEHRIEFGKLLAYEPASQMPLLMRGPGGARGRDLRRARRQHRPGADDRRDRRRRADARGRRPLAACRSPQTRRRRATGRC